MKKYFYLLLFLFIGLYSMEGSSNSVYYSSSSSDSSSLSNIDDYIFDQIEFLDDDLWKKNLNKNLDSFIKILPKDIWLMILSYLNYERNKKTIIEIWAPHIGTDDLTAKKIAIDFYRLAILNSKSLEDWSNMIKNVCKNWKDEKSVKLVKNYLDILNKDFFKKDKFEEVFDIEVYLSSLFYDLSQESFQAIALRALELKRKKLIMSESFFNLNKYKLRFGLHEISYPEDAYRDEFFASVAFCNIFYCLVFPITIVLSYYFFNVSRDSSVVFILAICLEVFFFCCCLNHCVKGLNCERKKRSRSFISFNNKIKRYLKINKVTLSDTDEYFFEYLCSQN